MPIQQSNALTLNGTSEILLVSGNALNLEPGQILGKTPVIDYTWTADAINPSAPFTGDAGIHITLTGDTNYPSLSPPLYLIATAWWTEVTKQKIAGTLTIRGINASREILVISTTETAIPELNNAIGYHVWGSDKSDPSTGEFSIEWAGYSGPVIALYLDDFGTQWQKNTTYAEGDIVYPSIWNGWQYECIATGTTDDAEPTWWHDEGSTSFSGTATFKARQYLPALADGPIIPYQWTEQ